MKNILLVLIKFYQSAVSVHFPSVCRYYPSCSAYAYEAVSKYGILRGCWMSVKRILRCHPFHHGGYDPVPELPNTAQGLTREIFL
jgi:putative membrane protein insertion efficiency factor